MGIFAIGLIPLAILIGIIVGIVALARRAGGGEEVPGIGTTRRLFLYGLAFISLMLAASGVTVLGSEVLESLTTNNVIRGGSGGTAFGLAAAIVGFPLWAILFRSTQRSLVEYPAEAGAFGRKFYMYAVLGISGGVVAGTLAAALQDAFSPGEFAAARLSPIVAWGGIWAFHWQSETREGQPTAIACSVRRLYVYLTSSYGLIMLATGVGALLSGSIGAAYDRIFEVGLINSSSTLWNDGTRSSIALAIVGGLWWYWHWHRVSQSDEDSALRRVVVHILGVLGGLVASVVAISTALFMLLIWLIDRPDFTSGPQHFDVLPGTIAALITAAGVWGYHGAIATAGKQASEAGWRAAHRAYRYLSAAVGLGTLAAGLILMIGVAIGLTVPEARSSIAGERWWSNQLAAAITLLLVGAPLWARQWTVEQTAAISDPGIERQALARRAYIFGVLGVAILSTIAALSTVLFQILQTALDGNLSSDVFDDTKWAIATLIAAGAISGYHWLVLREDREAIEVVREDAPAAAPVTKEITAAASASASSLIDAIATLLGTSVTHWERTDGAPAPQLSERQIENVAERVRETASERVLLVIDGRGVQVIGL
jgi:hypothetical protein